MSAPIIRLRLRNGRTLAPAAVAAISMLVPAAAVAGVGNDQVPPGHAHLPAACAQQMAQSALPPGLQGRPLPPGLAKKDRSAGAPCDRHDDASPAAPASGGAAPNVTVVTTTVASSTSARSCASHRYFQMQLDRPHLKLRSAKVWLNGKRITVHTGRHLTALIDLRFRKAGTYTVRSVVRTASGHTITRVRKFRTCAAKTARR